MLTYETPVRLLWWQKQHTSQVLDIERLTSAQPLTKEGFASLLADKDTVGMVALKADMVVGYMIYQLDVIAINLLCLSVHPEWQRQDIGTQLIHKLGQKIFDNKRYVITTQVVEDDRDRIFFLRALGFKAYAVSQNMYEDLRKDGFLFRLTSEDAIQWKNYEEIARKNYHKEGFVLGKEAF